MRGTSKFERYVNFEFYKTAFEDTAISVLFERYVNFEFYKTLDTNSCTRPCLRDM